MNGNERVARDLSINWVQDWYKNLMNPRHSLCHSKTIDMVCYMVMRRWIVKDGLGVLMDKKVWLVRHGKQNERQTDADTDTIPEKLDRS